jgi:hypothetical protein
VQKGGAFREKGELRPSVLPRRAGNRGGVEDMAVDWGEALRVGGTGFGTVFLVLVILAVAITLIGLAARRLNRSQTNSEQKGE